MKKTTKGTKIDKRVCIKVFVLGEARKEEALLNALLFGESLIVTNRPAIGKNLFRLDA